MSETLQISVPLTEYLSDAVPAFDETDFNSDDELDKTARGYAEVILRRYYGIPEDDPGDIESFEAFRHAVEYLKTRVKTPRSTAKKSTKTFSNHHFVRNTLKIEGNPSLVRVSCHAGAISRAAFVRRKLWGDPAPPFPASTPVELETALKRAVKVAKNTVGGGPEFVIETVIYLKNPDGTVPSTPPENAMRLRLKNCFSIHFQNTNMGHKLTLAVQVLRAQYEPDWIDERDAAILLLTGFLPKLPSISLTPVVQGYELGLGWPQYEVFIHDIHATSQKDLLRCYRLAAQGKKNRPDGRFDFKLSGSSLREKTTPRGRPPGQLDEALAFVELELILERARERVELGESILPQNWDWRPTNEEMKEAWNSRGWIYYTTPGSSGKETRALSPQKLRQFRKTVARDIYLPGLLQFLTEDDFRTLQEGEAADVRFARAYAAVSLLPFARVEADNSRESGYLIKPLTYERRQYTTLNDGLTR